MENNPQNQANQNPTAVPNTPFVVTPQVQPVVTPSSQQTGQINHLTSQIPPNSKKTNWLLLAIVGAVLLFVIVPTIVLGAYIFRKKVSPASVGSNVIETNYEKDGVKYKSFQYDDIQRKSLETPCYTSTVPNSSTSEIQECSLNVVMPDTTMPFIKIVAITEPSTKTAEEAVYDTEEAIRNKYESSGNTKYRTYIKENILLGGLNSYLLTYSDGSFNYNMYFVDVPKSKNYKLDGIGVIGFVIDAFANDPETDVFTKYSVEFIENLKFK